MCAHVQFWVVEDLLLEQLFFALFVHVLFQKVEWCVGLLGLDGAAHALLFLEDCVQVLVVGVVATSLDVAHFY